MQKRVALTKALAIAGTALAGFPILMTVATSIMGTISEGVFLCDYLLPAELFFEVLAGGLLLLWAAFRSRMLRKPIIMGLAAICVFLAASQLIAVLSGIASGAAEAAGATWILIVVLLALYVLAEIELFVAGIVLIKRVFAQSRSVD